MERLELPLGSPCHPLELAHDGITEESLGGLIVEGLDHGEDYTGYRETVKAGGGKAGILLDAPSGR